MYMIDFCSFEYEELIAVVKLTGADWLGLKYSMPNLIYWV